MLYFLLACACVLVRNCYELHLVGKQFCFVNDLTPNLHSDIKQIQCIVTNECGK